MRLVGNTGNLGIGRPDPPERLSVDGNAYIDGDLVVTGTISGFQTNAALTERIDEQERMIAELKATVQALVLARDERHLSGLDPSTLHGQFRVTHTAVCP